MNGADGLKDTLKPPLTSDTMQGRSQEFGFTEARLKGTLCAGGLGDTAPQKLTQYIKVNFCNLLNSYDNTMAYYAHKL